MTKKPTQSELSRALLRQVTDYCKRNAMAESAFGRKVMGDSNFIPELRDGREPNGRTIGKVQAFLQLENEPPQVAAE